VIIVGLGLFLTLTQQTYSIPLQAQLRLGWVTTLELKKHGAADRQRPRVRDRLRRAAAVLVAP
jgi:hypothetical protein